MGFPRDDNRIPTIRAASNNDGKTIINVCCDDNTHSICISDGNTGTDYGTINAQRDPDRVPVLLAVSSVDGQTPVEVYANSDGELLIQST